MSNVLVPRQTDARTTASASAAGWLARALESDLFYSFRRSKLTMAAAAVTMLFFLLAIFASLLAVQNTSRPRKNSVRDSALCSPACSASCSAWSRAMSAVRSTA